MPHPTTTNNPISNQGILLINKKRGTNSFRLVSILRRLTGIKKIGHAGTLDPFATGLMVLLIGREYTQKSHLFLNSDKEYQATLFLGAATDTYDIDGKITDQSHTIPSLEEVQRALLSFQGEIQQVPPMFSAKKVQGKKLYELARKGIEIERKSVTVRLQIELVSYDYPNLKIGVRCSKGTYIRSLAHDIGKTLGAYAHLIELQRTRSGAFSLEHAIAEDDLTPGFSVSSQLRSWP